MSAYVVADATIGRVLFNLGLPDTFEYLRREIATAAELDLNDDDFNAKLGVSMLHMNTDAICERYEDIPHDTMRTRAEFNPNAREFDPRPVPCNIVQAYKSLCCFLYQCSEGDIDKRPLYKALKDYEHYLAHSIISALPVYDQAEWA